MDTNTTIEVAQVDQNFVAKDRFKIDTTDKACPEKKEPPPAEPEKKNQDSSDNQDPGTDVGSGGTVGAGATSGGDSAEQPPKQDDNGSSAAGQAPCGVADPSSPSEKEWTLPRDVGKHAVWGKRRLRAS